MRQKKARLAGKIIRAILLFAVVFFLLLLIFSANWFFANFGEVEFATVVYQLLSPMDGTATDVLEDYFYNSLFPTIICAALFTVIFTIADSALRRLLFTFKVSAFGRQREFTLGNRFRKVMKPITLFGAFAVMAAVIARKADEMDVFGYLSDVTHSSTIFEEEYVDPNAVSLVFPKQKRNLLFIYMESMEATYASVKDGGGKPDNYIPELTQLAFENISFSDDEDIGGARPLTGAGWTMGGLLASTAGVPYKLPIQAPEVNDVREYNDSFLPGITALGELLAAEGYHNYFMCGSDAVFGGRRLFFEQHGAYGILDYELAKAEGFIPEDYYANWGMEDQKLYEYAKIKLTEIAGEGTPFNFTMLTVDTHNPDGWICELCEDEYPSQYGNAIACASRQVSEFLAWVQEQEWYENTTIIISGDHLSMEANFWDDIGDYERRVYNCFINVPAEVKAANTKNRIFTTLDTFPTTLAALNVEIEGDRLGLGTNLFSDRETLPEEMGYQEFNNALARNSNYYNMNFVVKK